MSEVTDNSKKQSIDIIEESQKRLKSLSQSMDSAFVQPFKSLDALFKKIGEFPSAIEGIQNSFKGLQDGSVDFQELSNTFSGIKNLIDMTKDSIGAMGSALGVLKSPTGIIAAALGVLYISNEDFRNSINGLVLTLMESLAPLLPPLTELFNQVAEIFGTLVSQIAGSLAPTIQALSEFLGQLLTAIMPIVTIFLQMVTDLLPSLAAVFTPILDIFMSLIVSILPPLLSVLTPLLDLLTTLAMEILPVISPILKIVADLLQGLFSDSVMAVVQILSDLLMPILEVVTAVFEYIACLLTGDLDGAIKSFGKCFSGLKNLMIGILQSIINFFAGFINFFIEGINAVIKLINLIPGVNIPLIGKLDWSNALDFMKTPAMATGGVVSKPTMALVGEGRYPEAVVPLGNSPQFSQMKNDITAAVLQGMAAMGGSRASSAPMELVLSLDGEKFARTIIPAIDRENRRKGLRLQVREV